MPEVLMYSQGIKRFLLLIGYEQYEWENAARYIYLSITILNTRILLTA